MASKSSSPKKIILVSLIVAGVVVLLYGYGLGFIFNDVTKSIEEVRHINTQLDKPKPHTEALSESKSDDVVPKQPEPAKSGTIAPDYPAKSVEKAPDYPAKSVEKAPDYPAKSVEKAPEKPAKSVKDRPITPEGQTEDGHIPFTNLPVTPGDPESYYGTVGQCPFYEIATKGCYPPPYIECNEDWSVCTMKEEQDAWQP